MVGAGRIACRAGWLLAALLTLALARAADAQIFVYKGTRYGRTYFSDTPQHDGFPLQPQSDRAAPGLYEPRPRPARAPTIPRSSARPAARRFAALVKP
jgi:hypothetical protein